MRGELEQGGTLLRRAEDISQRMSLHRRRRRTPNYTEYGRANVLRHALEAQAFKDAAQPIANRAVNQNVECHIANHVGLDAFGHCRKCGRAPDKLLLAFRKAIGAPQVIADHFDKIAKAPSRLRAPVQAIDAK